MGGRSAADIPKITELQTGDIDKRFGDARSNAGTAFDTASAGISDLASSQRQNILSDFAGRREGTRQTALSTLPPSLRNSGVGQSAVQGFQESQDKTEADVLRGVNQSQFGAENALISQELGSTLGLDQAQIKAFMAEIQSRRAAEAGLGGAKIASDTAANTGGTFGHGGFLGLGI